MANEFLLKQIDEKLHKELKIAAINEGISMNELIKNIIAEYLKRKK